MKQVVSLRPEYWLLEAVKAYAQTHNLVDGKGKFNFTKTLHNYIRDLQSQAEARKELNIMKQYVERLQKEAKPFHCIPLNSETTTQECFQCIMRARENPAKAPKEVQECPRVKGVL